MSCRTPLLAALAAALFAATIASAAEDKFRPLDDVLPQPNSIRTASGAPGPDYWQQRVDYVITAALDEENRRLSGTAKITYYNQSPDPLTFLWLQLDRNLLKPDSWSARTTTIGSDPTNIDADDFNELVQRSLADHGIESLRITDESRRALRVTAVDTLLRVDLPASLRSGEKFVFHAAWAFPINPAGNPNSMRSGYETFGDDDAGTHAVYCLGLWYPRLAAYTDYAGWAVSPFLGEGEFALEFGNYEVRLTVPDDHVVSATGALQNPDEVLTRVQRDRLKDAESSRTPVFIVTPDEALAAEQKHAAGQKTWVFAAENVRDFAFASSRSFIWDAMAVPGQSHRNRPVLAMSYYPKEGRPIWDKFSTHAIAHAIDVCSSLALPYPYPTACAVLGGVTFGMEYPMLSFNGTRPEPDGTYAAKTKYLMVSTVIHESVHNYFPMAVNSDERRWGWLDEGLTTFLEDTAIRLWEPDPHFARRRLDDIIEQMRDSDERAPVMTAADTLPDTFTQFYDQPNAALMVLREVVLGRERFDFALRTYVQRWMFKRATPADFFRTMEDASGSDLDWFWRGWFFSNDHVDIGISRVAAISLQPDDRLAAKLLWIADRAERPVPSAELHDQGLPRRTDVFPELQDKFSTGGVLPLTRREQDRINQRLKDGPLEPAEHDRHVTFVEFRNHGGIVTPLPLRLEFTDGKMEDRMIPAEIWRKDSDLACTLLVTDRAIAAVTVDPQEDLTDVDPADNRFPRSIEQVRLNISSDQIEGITLDEALSRWRVAAPPKEAAPSPIAVPALETTTPKN